MEEKMSKKVVYFVLVVLLCTSILAGCGGASSAANATSAASSSSAASVETKDTFVIGRIGVPYNFDPAYIGENLDIWNITNIYDQLVRVSADAKTLEPDLATSWDISSDGLTYTFHLRQGVVFSDGTPLKASDVKFSLDRARAADCPWGYIFSDIKSVEAPDDATAVITINTANSSFLSVMAMFNASIVSEAYATKAGKEGMAKQPMGTGAYTLKEYVSGQYALFEANPNYWEKGLPKTKYIKWVSITDDNTRILQLQSGQIDAAEYIPLNRISELQADPNLKVDLFPSTFVYYLVPNYNKELFQDKNVRLALYYATDRDALVKLVLYNLGTVANSYMSPATPMYSKDATTPSFDLAKAKEYLSKTSHPNGFDVNLLIVSGDSTDEALATALKEMWSKIGVNVNIQALEYGARQDKLAARDYDLHLTFWTDDLLDPDEISTYEIDFPVAGSMNSDYNNPELVKMVEEARTITDTTKRAEAYTKIQQMFNDDAAMLPLYYKPFSVATTSKVHDFVQLPVGTYIYKNLWVEKN
jgi:peptide/nickel transport system substrate-binding protein